MKMKSIFYVATAAMITLACTREVEKSDSINQRSEIKLTATWASEDNSLSRTILQENGTSVWWTTGEEINAFFGTMASGKFTSTNTKPQATVSFTGTLTSLIGEVETEEGISDCWAIYPYNETNTCDGQSVSLTVSSEQTATSGTFADKFFPAVAKSNSFSLAFYNVCGGARFSVTQEGVKKIIFKSNDGSPMAGKVKVGFGDDNRPQILEITEPVDSVVINAPEGGFVPGTNYFAAMLPQTHAQGMTIQLRTLGKKATRTLSSQILVNRSTFGILENVDEGLEYEDHYCTPEIVDLGLSVEWASFNLGASVPEEYGLYFAWGETEAKTKYVWATYKYCNGTQNSITKYCSDAQYGYNGFIDNLTVLSPEDDAATELLGEGWRMPTVEEWRDLINNCTWTWTTNNGVNGWMGMSDLDGYTTNGIFLPAAHAKTGGISMGTPGNYGYYWSSSVSTGSQYFAYYASFDSITDVVQVRHFNRSIGMPIRPVRKKIE